MGESKSLVKIHFITFLQDPSHEGSQIHNVLGVFLLSLLSLLQGLWSIFIALCHTEILMCNESGRWTLPGLCH